eukprot:TRINITY_DN17261_c0_g1_i2.p1 TRINITY_DN17261_c0_g1~~TRINITY_DN17261_c0_g1_i2.p1  ORF type:complete len:358 (+),score=29.77 TRINITY_DN17261_c0_g1_i2:50-1123(+)
MHFRRGIMWAVLLQLCAKFVVVMQSARVVLRARENVGARTGEPPLMNHNCVVLLGAVNTNADPSNKSLKVTTISREQYRDTGLQSHWRFVCKQITYLRGNIRQYHWWDEALLEKTRDAVGTMESPTVVVSKSFANVYFAQAIRAGYVQPKPQSLFWISVGATWTGKDFQTHGLGLFYPMWTKGEKVPPAYKSMTYKMMKLHDPNHELTDVAKRHLKVAFCGSTHRGEGMWWVSGVAKTISLVNWRTIKRKGRAKKAWAELLDSDDGTTPVSACTAAWPATCSRADRSLQNCDNFQIVHATHRVLTEDFIDTLPSKNELWQSLEDELDIFEQAVTSPTVNAVRPAGKVELLPKLNATK